MSSFLGIFPAYLVLLSGIFVIIPTIIAAVLRHSLYRYLIDSANKVSRLISLGTSRGKQPAIVDKLEARFKEASQKLENVNTMALIDGLYSQERLSFLGISLRCEQWDYFCQNLPNLLLGFGLLGTFIGISSNLYHLSQTLDQSSDNINNLVEQLQIPLQNMGVAFFTSLTAIFCSSILIIINLRCNTNFAKALLISFLEDYLDNIFKVNIQGYSRMDQAVDRMVRQQQEFLIRFRENVQEVLEDSFGKAADKIVNANYTFQNNVDLLVTRFNDISNTMATSTDGFQEAVFNLEQQVTTVTNIMPQFEASSNKLERSAERHLQASYKIEQSKFSEHLEQLTSDLITTQKSFSESTEFLGNHVNQLVINNQKTQNLTKEIYTQLKTSSTNIKNGAVKFNEAAQSFRKTDFADKLTSATQQLTTIPEQFNQSTTTLYQSTESINVAINNINNLVQEVNTLNQISSKLLKSCDRNITTQSIEFQHIESELKRIVEQLQKHQQAVNKGLESFGGRVLTTFQENSSHNIEELQKLNQTILNLIREINKVKFGRTL